MKIFQVALGILAAAGGVAICLQLLSGLPYRRLILIAAATAARAARRGSH